MPEQYYDDLYNILISGYNDKEEYYTHYIRVKPTKLMIITWSYKIRDLVMVTKTLPKPPKNKPESFMKRWERVIKELD